MSEQLAKSKPAQHVVTERKRDEPVSTPSPQAQSAPWASRPEAPRQRDSVLQPIR
jgi:hypothetical protein